MEQQEKTKQYVSAKSAAIVLYHMIFILIILINFPFGKWFIGWDALSPELNFALNFKRALTAVWQENYGLGTMTGHGFAATLPHTAITWFFSLFVPTYAVRAVFTFFCLYLGGLGMLFLSTKILLNTMAQKKRIVAIAPHIGLLSALWYIGNLGTMQIFYVQLESFIAQFALLPWAFVLSIAYLQTGKKKWLLAYAGAIFIGSIQGFIPSLFVSFMLVMTLFLGGFVLKTKRLKTVLFILIITLCINLYWLLPVFVHQTTQGKDFLRAYNNITTTDDFIAKNQKYGTIASVALLKSFYLDTKDSTDFSFAPWIKHYDQPLIVLTAWSFFAISLLGVAWCGKRILKRNVETNDFGVFFVLGFGVLFVLLATGAPVFAQITNILQVILPTFKQAFRSTFTKFGVVFIFHFALFITIGLGVLFDQLLRKSKKPAMAMIAFVAVLTALILITIPLFRGNLLYKKLALSVPHNYFDVMNFFNAKPAAGRIADFPQGCSEGWYGYNWGYFGSGFMWYGVKQPFLSRTFDVWSRNNENYFWQVSQVLKKRDYKGLDAIMEKYNVSWILYDPNFLHCRSSKAFYDQFELTKHLDSSPLYTLAGEYDSPDTRPIRIYQYKGSTNTSYVGAIVNAPNIGPRFTYTDTVFHDSDYLTRDKQAYETYYPYANAFTKRAALLQDNASLTIDKDTISVKTQLPQNVANYTLRLPAFSEIQKVVPIRLSVESERKDTQKVALELLMPKLMIDGVAINEGSARKKDLANGLSNATIGSGIWYINGEQISSDAVGEKGYLELYLSTKNNNRIELLSATGAPLISWESQSDTWFLNHLDKTMTVVLTQLGNGLLTTTIPKVFDDKTYGLTVFGNKLSNYVSIPCNRDEKYISRYQTSTTDDSGVIQMLSQNRRDCLRISLPEIDSSVAYMMEVRSQTIRGEKPVLRVLDKSAQLHIQTPLATTNKMQTFYHIINSGAPFDKGYVIEFENKSYSNNESISNFGGLAMWHIPLDFIQQIRLDNNAATRTASQESVQSKRVNEIVYEVTFDKSIKENTTLTLRQGYHAGWSAYVIGNTNTQTHFLQRYMPFLFGSRLRDHVLVNGWANGWVIESSKCTNGCTIIVLFWPVYLLVFGYIVLIVTFLRLILVKYKS